jgi:hypothetical protein
MKRKGKAIRLASPAIYVAFVNLLVVAAVILLQSKLPPEIPLFYGLPDGEKQLAPTLALVAPNTTALIVTVVNSLIAAKIGNDLIRKALVASSIAATFLATVTVIKIILLVGYI